MPNDLQVTTPFDIFTHHPDPDNITILDHFVMLFRQRIIDLGIAPGYTVANETIRSMYESTANDILRDFEMTYLIEPNVWIVRVFMKQSDLLIQIREKKFEGTMEE